MRTRPESISFRTLCTLILPAAFLCACASTRQPDATQTRISTMEQQISRNEEVISDLSQRLSVMQFMVDSHERMLRNPSGPSAATTPASSAIQQPEKTKTGASSPAPASHVSSPAEQIQDPNRLYEKAFATMQNREYEKAADLFQQLATRFPDHSLADNALYWLAECHYARRDYRQAITAFEEVPKRYPQGGKVPDAMLKNAFSRIQIGDKENAREILRQLIREYPFTDAAAKAETRLKNLF